MQMSYLQMFSTMFSAFPPVLYWLPKSVAVIHLCRELRSKGIPAWETMDAGPQVKILTDSENSAKIKTALLELDNSLRLFEDKVGTGPVIKPG
jgi:diphosphomevalonate decarboxylase